MDSFITVVSLSFNCFSFIGFTSDFCLWFRLFKSAVQKAGSSKKWVKSLNCCFSLLIHYLLVICCFHTYYLYIVEHTANLLAFRFFFKERQNLCNLKCWRLRGASIEYFCYLSFILMDSYVTCPFVCAENGLILIPKWLDQGKKFTLSWNFWWQIWKVW